MATDELTVRDGMVVRLEYRISFPDGELVETSEEEGPVEFLQGYQQIIPGLESALYGMAVGEEKDVVVSPATGYGEYDEEAVEIVPQSIFPDEVDLELGMVVELIDEETGEALDGIVSEILLDDVVLDLNHPLAGATLNFHVTVTGLRQASPSELTAGRVSDAGHATL
jgi:FKBP-type peptidyl-prolyl cis-trans isomerase SlyD